MITNYEKYYSTPEKVAASYAYANECPIQSTALRYGKLACRECKFNGKCAEKTSSHTIIDEFLAWLNMEAE